MTLGHSCNGRKWWQSRTGSFFLKGDLAVLPKLASNTRASAILLPQPLGTARLLLCLLLVCFLINL